MSAKIATIGCTARRAIVSVSLCLCAIMLCLAPRLAWADEPDDIPVGVLSICDNPFAIDCGHDHAEVSLADSDQACTSVDYFEMQDDEATYEPRLTIISEAESASSDLSVLDDCASGFANQSAQIDFSASSCNFGEADVLPAARLAATLDADSATSQIAQIPRTSAASTCDSSSSEVMAVPAASSSEARVIVDDEGLGHHEYATVLAEVKPGISRYELNELVSTIGGLSVSDVADEDLEYGLVKCAITNGATILETIARITQCSGIISAQPNYVYRSSGASVQEVLDDTWANYQWALDSVHAYDAWDIVKTSGSVGVAVIDTGADLDHPDLADNIVATYNSLSNVNTVEDQLGHGTHVAGIIAAVANNGKGVAGVSYNAKLLIIKATPFKSESFDTSSIVRAYEWLMSLDSSGKTVAEHYNVRVVNMSIGGFDEGRMSHMPDDVIVKAMRKARDEYGILTVCAAANGTPDSVPFAAYPGDSDVCLSVMNLWDSADSTNYENNVSMSSTSNYNVEGSRYKDICAPGSTIYSTWLDGRYASSSGTSMAAPLVAGIAAMVFAVNPHLTPQMAIDILEISAIDLGFEGWDGLYAYGEVDAAAAVRLANASRIDGYRVVGIGGSASYEAILAPCMAEDEYGFTWRVVRGTGNATVDQNGVLTGKSVGTVTLFATCRTTVGTEISAVRTVNILKADIVGNAVLRAGASSIPYTTTESNYTWVWKVEEDTGTARIDQDAVLVAGDPGVVYVTATCASNTDIVIRKKVTIVA